MNGCYNCGSPDHWKDACPLAARAASYDEHLGRINGFVDRWAEGGMTIEQKRLSIGQENMQWYGAGCPLRLRWPPF
jgi:hypothetical protein